MDTDKAMLSYIHVAQASEARVLISFSNSLALEDILSLVHCHMATDVAIFKLLLYDGCIPVFYNSIFF